jgi:hypothetical protein
VSDFSIKICGEIEKSGTKSVVTAEGKLDAGVSTIIKKIVGGGSAEISGTVLSETYENVARDELGQDRFNVRECRQKMVEVAVRQVCSGQIPTAPSTGGASGGNIAAGPILINAVQGEVYQLCDQATLVYQRPSSNGFVVALNGYRRDMAAGAPFFIRTQQHKITVTVMGKSGDLLKVRFECGKN